MFTIENGSKVKSKIRGFEGIISARSENLHGCNRYFVEPPATEDGKLPEGYWFDEADLTVIQEKAVEKANNDRGGFASKTK